MEPQLPSVPDAAFQEYIEAARRLPLSTNPPAGLRTRPLAPDDYLLPYDFFLLPAIGETSARLMLVYVPRMWNAAKKLYIYQPQKIGADEVHRLIGEGGGDLSFAEAHALLLAMVARDGNASA